MQSRKLENRGTIVSGIAWEPTKLPQQRICGCGRPIARISKLDHCQRCEDSEYEERLLLAGRPRNPPVRVHAPRVHEGPRKPPRKLIGWSMPQESA
jgi:hypothetical protein